MSTKRYDLAYMFKKTFTESLLSYRLYDLRIDLKDGFELLFEPLYKLLQHELETL